MKVFIVVCLFALVSSGTGFSRIFKKRETLEENLPPAPILSRSEHLQRDVIHEPVVQTQHREFISTVSPFPVKGGTIRGTNNFGVKGVSWLTVSRKML